MSRLKPRPMPTFQELLKQQSSRPDGEVLIQTDIPSQESGLEPRMIVAVQSEKIPLADAAFCRQCGEWLTPDYIQMGIKFRCPKCNYCLFTINRVGSREKWEKNYEQTTKEEER